MECLGFAPRERFPDGMPARNVTAWKTDLAPNCARAEARFSLRVRWPASGGMGHGHGLAWPCERAAGERSRRFAMQAAAAGACYDLIALIAATWPSSGVTNFTNVSSG